MRSNNGPSLGEILFYTAPDGDIRVAVLFEAETFWLSQWRRGAGARGPATPDYFNPDAIIAVGYRVNSRQAARSRIWGTSVLREFIIRGSDALGRPGGEAGRVFEVQRISRGAVIEAPIQPFARRSATDAVNAVADRQCSICPEVA